VKLRSTTRLSGEGDDEDDDDEDDDDVLGSGAV
jgi:hypothetical protein